MTPTWQKLGHTLQPRDRRALAVAAAVLALWALWHLAWAPAWQTLQTAPLQRTHATQQWHAMRALAHEAQVLRQSASPGSMGLPPDRLMRALEQSTQEALGHHGQVRASPDGITVTLDQAPADRLAHWLAATRTQLRLKPSTAQLTRSSDTPARWSGTLQLTGEGLPRP